MAQQEWESDMAQLKARQGAQQEWQGDEQWQK